MTPPAAPSVAHPPPELDPLKLEALQAITAAFLAGDPLVVIDIVGRRAKPMSEAAFAAATGFGGLFDDEKGQG